VPIGRYGFREGPFCTDALIGNPSSPPGVASRILFITVFMRKLTWDEINRPSPEDVQGLPKHPIRVVAHNVRSIHNVGSIFRTSDGARIEHVHLTGFTGTPDHDDLHKTALGAQDAIPWTHHDRAIPLLRELQSRQYTISVLEITDEAESTDRVQPDAFPLCLVLGNEVRGVDDEIIEIADKAFSLPQFGTKISLNVGVAYGIAVYDLVRRYRSMNGPPGQN